jgi:ABC-type amino acid transport system permease subunit
MSYQEKNVTVALVSHLLILVYYLFNLLPIIQSGEWIASKLYALWLVVIGATILVTIIGSILTNIILSIFEAIRSQKYEDPRFITDERDHLIELKGIRIEYITYSIGVLLSIFVFIFGQPPLMMISLIFVFGILAEIAGDIAKITLYRQGL